MLRSIVLGWILVYRNWSIAHTSLYLPPTFCINYLLWNALGRSAYSHFTTIDRAKCEGKTEWIMGNWKKENCEDTMHEMIVWKFIPEKVNQTVQPILRWAEYASEVNRICNLTLAGGNFYVLIAFLETSSFCLVTFSLVNIFKDYCVDY